MLILNFCPASDLESSAYWRKEPKTNKGRSKGMSWVLLKENNKTATKKASEEWSNKPPKGVSCFFFHAIGPSNKSLRMANIKKKLAVNHHPDRITQTIIGAMNILNRLKELARVRKFFT